MSHFTSIKTKLTNKAALVKGLEGLLQEKGIEAPVEVFDKPQRLINRYARNDTRYAEVIVRSQFLSVSGRSYQAKVDVGYCWNQQHQQFELQVDPYDFQRNKLGEAYHTVRDFSQAVQLEHDKVQLYEKLEVEYPQSAWIYGEEVVLEDGSIQIELNKKPELCQTWY